MNKEYTGEDQEKEAKFINPMYFDVFNIECFIAPYAKFDFICDIGSGLGYYLHHLSTKFGTTPCKIIGYDVSAICVNKAQSNYPYMEFIEKDFTKKSNEFVNTDGFRNRLFSSREALKYIIHEVDNVVYNFNKLIPSGDLFIISNNLPTQSKLSSDEYEAEQSFVIKDINSFIKKMEENNFILLRSVVRNEYSSEKRSQGMFVALFKKK